ncbi:hypothetical protein [Janibacter anophelis]|uniref:hypothetical protein n=1 Tax=Janibacter anophelis TaxID=319054 RepID=UPI0012EE697E|nr:hypothetical protein [Janibacter anophelis]
MPEGEADRLEDVLFEELVEELFDEVVEELFDEVVEELLLRDELAVSVCDGGMMLLGGT